MFVCLFSCNLLLGCQVFLHLACLTMLIHILNNKEFVQFVFIFVTNCKTVDAYLWNCFQGISHDAAIFVAANCSCHALGNLILKMWYGILLPWMPISTLYSISVVFWLLLVFNFTNITKNMLLKVKEATFTISYACPLLCHDLCHGLPLFWPVLLWTVHN